ncbi:hypothetical protein [Vallitalea guaymasensis]|uniref:hypothetical protein n=1 Tax=Vallitalea guaymasensis TaxID=1185412 RepID=UPI002355AAAD|nr:hypothetical protein [Vallitalea guaymasensis]
MDQRGDALDTLIDETANRRILEMFDCLTEIQKRRFIAHYIDGKTFRAIALEEGVNHTKIQKCIEQTRSFSNRGYKSPFFSLLMKGAFLRHFMDIEK